MTGVQIVDAIVEIMFSGITGVSEAVGSGLSTLAQSIFLAGNGETQTLSTFGVLIIVFAGISLAIGLSRLVVNWVTSFGN